MEYQETNEEIGNIALFRYGFKKDLIKCKEGLYKPEFKILGKCNPEFLIKPKKKYKDLIIKDGMIYKP